MSSSPEITGRLRSRGAEDEKKLIMWRQEKVPRERSGRAKGPEAGRSLTQDHKGQCGWAECLRGACRRAARGGWPGIHLKAVLVRGHFQPRLNQKPVLGSSH